MPTTIHTVIASVVKVTVGPASGNRVGRIIFRDGVIPEGVEPEQLERLVERGLIKPVTILSPEEIAAVEVKAAAEAEAKAAAAKKASAPPAK